VQAAPIETRLRGVPLPSDGDGVRAAFDKLPSEVAGLPRDANSEERGPTRYAAYFKQAGSTLPNAQFIAMDVANGDFFPAGSTAADIIALFATGGDWTVMDTGTEEGLVWVEYTTTASDAATGASQQMYILQWGHPEGSWVFGVQVRDPANLIRVLDAYLAALRGTAP
jgi:hypothetical protein